MQLPTIESTARVADFSAAHAPALTVQPGQRFAMETHDRFAGMDEESPRGPHDVDGLVGPVAIAGAKAGDILAIDVIGIRPRFEHAYMLGSTGFGVLGERMQLRARKVAITETTIHYDNNTILPWRPMIGKLGIAPAGSAQASNTVGEFGGAVSCTEVAPGATLLLPVACDGALLSIEDVHGTMGDGEATASAVEMPARVMMRCRLNPAPTLPAPLLLTGTEVLTLGSGETLDAACMHANEQMLALIMARRNVDLTEAGLLAGAVVDFRVSYFGGKPRKARAAISRTLLGF